MLHLAARTTSIAGAASSSMRMNHCSEMSGSIRSPERCEYGTLCVYGSVATIAVAERRDDRLARLERGHARELAGLGGHPPVLADDADGGQAVLAADLEVVRVVARA